MEASDLRRVESCRAIDAGASDISKPTPFSAQPRK